jgi:hypothetical protein
MQKSDGITIRFVLTKGEGDWPELSELCEDEAQDLTRICRFCFEWCPTIDLAPFDLTDFLSCEVVFDGVTHLPGVEAGMWIEDGMIEGYPTPILRFRLKRAVDVAEFRLSVFSSFVAVHPRVRPAEDAYFAEDHNGYTGVLAANELRYWRGALAREGYTSDLMLTPEELWSQPRLVRGKRSIP